MTEINGNENKVQWEFKNSSDWAVGIALIIIGGLFLLDSLNILHIHLVNWWAVFILIPGINMTVKGWRGYRETQSQSSRSTALWGMCLILVAFGFFFGVSWNLLFPVALIGLGGYMLLFRK